MSKEFHSPAGDTAGTPEVERRRTAPDGYISVHEAADRLSVSPWEVLNLTERGDLTAVTLIEAESLANYARRVTA